MSALRAPQGQPFWHRLGVCVFFLARTIEQHLGPCCKIRSARSRRLYGEWRSMAIDGRRRARGE
eukprot:28936-Pyramimonas_sp.AAC.1